MNRTRAECLLLTELAVITSTLYYPYDFTDIPAEKYTNDLVEAAKSLSKYDTVFDNVVAHILENTTPSYFSESTGTYIPISAMSITHRKRAVAKIIRENVSTVEYNNIFKNLAENSGTSLRDMLTVYDAINSTTSSGLLYYHLNTLVKQLLDENI